MTSIFKGSPQSATSYTTANTETPKWMQDAIYNQVNWAQNLANRPYESYDLPTVAGLSPLQQQAFTGIENQQGNYQAAFDAAATGVAGQYEQDTGTALAASQAALLNPAKDSMIGRDLNAAESLFDQAGEYNMRGVRPMIREAGNMSGYDAASSGLDNAASFNMRGVRPMMREASNMSGLATASPNLQLAGTTTAEALSDRAINAANPYLEQASRSSVSDVDQYMNPYQTNVLDAIAQQGERNLTENLLPAVSDSFIKAGQFGSRNMGEFGSRALRDTQESILREQAPLLQQGYNQALQASAADKSRQGTLAGTAGSVAGADLSRVLQGGSQYANIGQTTGQLTNQDAARKIQAAQAMGQLTSQQAQNQLAIANSRGQLTNQDANRKMQAGQALGQLTSQQMQNQMALGAQRVAAGQQQQQFGLSAADAAQRAAAQDYSRELGALQTGADMSIARQGAEYRDISALEAAGRSEQQQLQTELSAAEQEWLAEQNYPQAQMDWLSAQIRGLAPYGDTKTSTSAQSTGATYGQSPLSQLAAGYSTYRGVTG
tara:strand:- start:10 stop:1653 length:1644 start_codon:yes stop_codon:yes gene_type:complete